MSAEVRVGFVTKVDAPDSFEVGTLRVNITPQTECVLYGDGKSNVYKGVKSCTTESLYFGTRILLKGDFTKTHVFVPTQLCTFKDEFLDVSDSFSSILGLAPPKGVLIRDPLSLEKPEKMQTAQGKQYLWWLDGYPMLLDSATQLLSSPNSEIATGDRRLTYNMNPPHTKYFEEDVHPLGAPSMLGPDMWVLYHYNSVAASENKGLATRIRVWPDTVTEDEKAYLALFDAVVTPPVYANTKQGSIQFHQGPPISIIADKKLQDEVSRLAETLIPAYQRGLSSTEPAKINFRFFVIRPFVYNQKMHLVSVDGFVRYNVDATGYRYDEPAFNKLITSVVTTPTGMVFVPDTLFPHLKNEAQLSALLADAIVAVTEKQGYRSWPWTQLHHSSFPMMSASALAEKAAQIRMGMRQMFLAGYDIRESPYVFALQDGLPIDNPVPVSDSRFSRSGWYTKYWYVGYTFSHISQYYRDVDYSKLKRGEAEYQQFLRELRKADPRAFTDTLKPMAP